MSLREVIIERIRSDGPLSFAAYMDLALYHPELGYYARDDRRSGRTGDFFTSVDLGSVFGELLSKQFAQMWRITVSHAGSDLDHFDLVEAGAGSGRLARDILDRSAITQKDFYAAVRCTLVERSRAARSAQEATLGRHLAKLGPSGTELPSRVDGIIFANELLDALPMHAVEMTECGLREVYVEVGGRRFVERLGPVSPTVQAHIERHHIRLEPGWRAEVSPAMVNWVEDAGRRLKHGFLVLVDYGHEAAELYSPAHASGTLTRYRKHRAETGADRSAATRPWLEEPGVSDITAHVDLTAVRQAAHRVGLRTLATLDQTYFLLGLASTGDGETAPDDGLDAIKRRLALKTLLLPGGLGSTHKVLIFGRNVGTPQLDGCSFSVRAT